MIVERLAAATTLDPAADDSFHQRVRRLLAEVLAGERWLDALEPLAKLDPAALAAVDRELHGYGGEQDDGAAGWVRQPHRVGG